MSAKLNKEAAVDAALIEKAHAVPAEEIVPLRYEPVVAAQACNQGLSFLKDHRPMLMKGYPGIDMKELQILPALCLQLSLAKLDVQRLSAETGASQTETVAAALEWRRKLIVLAEALAANALVSATEVSRIREGQGTVDYLTDVIALVALLKPHEAIVEATCGKGALVDAEKQAHAGLTYLGTLNDPTLRAQERAAIELRDRFATLVTNGHDRLRVAVAAVSSFREAQEIVPSLFGGRKRKAKASEEVEPSPDPEPA